MMIKMSLCAHRSTNSTMGTNKLSNKLSVWIKGVSGAKMKLDRTPTFGTLSEMSLNDSDIIK